MRLSNFARSTLSKGYVARMKFNVTTKGDISITYLHGSYEIDDHGVLIVTPVDGQNERILIAPHHWETVTENPAKL